MTSQPPKSGAAHPDPEIVERFEVQTTDDAATDGAGLASRSTAGLSGESQAAMPGAAGMLELARAFQANATALKGINEIHADLARAIKRGDRSELVVQSTTALNETFRNLTGVQESLLAQMKAVQDSQRRSPLLPLMLLGVLAVVLLGTWLIVREVQRSGVSTHEIARMRADHEKAVLGSYKDGVERGQVDVKAQLERVQEEFEKTQQRFLLAAEDRDAAQSEVDRLERTQRSLSAERDEMAQRAMKAQNEAMARKVVEDELRSAKADLIIAQRKLEQAEIDTAKARQRNEDLLKRLASEAIDLRGDESRFRVSRGDDAEPIAPDRPEDPLDSLPTEAGPEPEMPMGAGTPFPGRGAVAGSEERQPTGLDMSSLPPPPSGFPPPVDGSPETQTSELNRDPRMATAVQEQVNMLLRAVGRGSNYWQLASLGGYNDRKLGEVALHRYGPDGALQGSIEAKDLVIITNASRGTVDFVVRDGRRVVGTRNESLPRQGMRFSVTRKASGVQLWRSARLPMVRTE
jgi:hypothetical protein